MKALVKGLLLGSLLAALVVATTPVVTAQAPVTLEVYDPGGGVEITHVNAPRVDTLAGKTICEVALADNEWQTYRTFPVIRQFLAKQFPTAKIIEYTQFPNWREDPTIGKQLKAKGCQAVIVGNAG